MTQQYKIKIECNRCHKERDATLVMDHMQVVDSPGIMLFDWPDGPTCDICLKAEGMDPNTIVR